MNNDITKHSYPTSAYDLLEVSEREIVDEYVEYLVQEQKRKNQRVDMGKNLPIPSEYIKRSRGALLKPIVRAALSERIDEESRKFDISAEKVVGELAKIAFSDITDFMESGEFGSVNIKNLSEISPDKSGAIKSIETKIGLNGTNSKITMHDKLPALRALYEMMLLSSPNQNASVPEMIKSELKKAEDAPEVAYVELLENVERLTSK